MKQETALHVSTAIHGLIYAADELDKALLGDKRHLEARRAEHEGPFALALHRVAEIADGVPIQHMAEAQADLLFLWPLLHHLRGGFYSSLWDILARAHEVIAKTDLITEKKAKAILGEQGHWLDLDCRLGHIHPLEEVDGIFRTYDSTYLRGLTGNIRYARYEIVARADVISATQNALATQKAEPMNKPNGTEQNKHV